jgi:hypothetical protein
VLAAPIAALAALYYVLTHFAAHDVRDSWFYTFFYMVMGAAWIGVSEKLILFMGISARDDAIENRNWGGAYAYFGAVVGLMLCFAGGNIGDGPGWWVVLFSGGLAAGSFLALWFIFEKLASISEQITVERDEAAGMRLGALLLAMSLILGRAAAGNWVSVDATVRDFLYVGWGALPLMLGAALIEKFMPRPVFNPQAKALLRMDGMFPAAVYLVVAAGYVIWRGPW